MSAQHYSSSVSKESVLVIVSLREQRHELRRAIETIAKEIRAFHRSGSGNGRGANQRAYRAHVVATHPKRDVRCLPGAKLA